jgi:preprotein translocase subunit SecF
LIITVGIYGAFGFEVTPAAVIGFLTVLSYSLYDTVVVFDKVRENTQEIEFSETRTFGEMVNLAVNQTLVRSINTSIVGVLPVASILFIGSILLGAGTLRDIALVMMVGTIVGTYSSVFLAAPVYSHLRENEPALKAASDKVLAARS